jgi:hypothetical protein
MARALERRARLIPPDQPSELRVAVCGVGAVGSRAARQLASSGEIDAVYIVARDEARADYVADSLGPKASFQRWQPSLLDWIDALVVAAPLTTATGPLAAGLRLEAVGQALSRGVPVVTVGDAMAEVRSLLAMDDDARRAGVPLVIGAGMAPGLTDLLARQAAVGFDVVDEIHIAKAGTGGPACARQHHRALGAEAVDWREGEWVIRSGGSGRELSWFPDPVGGQDCYRAGLPDALLTAPAFPGVQRVTARVAATRRDRLTAALPMLRRPHPEGELGAVRVEVRGQRAGGRDVRVFGALDRPGVAAGAVAAVSALWAARGRMAPRAAGLAELVPDPGPFLAELARRGVKAAVFDGSGSPA